jgi:hypothetical protein
MLLPHHFNCFLGAVQIEFVVLLSFLRMLLTHLILNSICLSFRVNTPIKSLTANAGAASRSTPIVILSLAIDSIFHTWEEELVANWRIKIC